MTEAQALLRAAQAAEDAGRPHEARLAVERAASLAQSRRDRFETLLFLARAQWLAGELHECLATYWDARTYADEDAPLGTAEADFGIGLTLLDLGRHAEGVETMRRAGRAFRRAGHTLLAGCVEMALAEDLVLLGNMDGAERHLEVATDLLTAAGDPRMLSSLATLQAEVQARQGYDELAEDYLRTAKSAARGVERPAQLSELRRRRDAVRVIIRGVQAGADGETPGPA